MFKSNHIILLSAQSRKRHIAWRVVWVWGIACWLALPADALAEDTHFAKIQYHNAPINKEGFIEIAPSAPAEKSAPPLGGGISRMLNNGNIVFVAHESKRLAILDAEAAPKETADPMRTLAKQRSAQASQDASLYLAMEQSGANGATSAYIADKHTIDRLLEACDEPLAPDVSSRYQHMVEMACQQQEQNSSSVTFDMYKRMVGK